MQQDDSILMVLLLVQTSWEEIKVTAYKDTEATISASHAVLFTSHMWDKHHCCSLPVLVHFPTNQLLTRTCRHPHHVVGFPKQTETNATAQRDAQPSTLTFTPVAKLVNKHVFGAWEEAPHRYSENATSKPRPSSCEAPLCNPNTQLQNLHTIYFVLLLVR